MRPCVACSTTAAASSSDRFACDVISEDAVAWAQAHGCITVPYPGVIIDAALAGDLGLRLRAAAIHAGAGAALSHTSALAIWQLAPAGALVHVMTGPGRRMRAAGLVGHRRRGFVAEAPAVVTRSDLPVTALATSLIDAWPLLIGDAQRAPLLMAISNRQTTAERVAAALASRPNLPGRACLVDLLRLLAAGCRSPLELWGYQRVFTGPGFERLRWQVPVDLGRRAVWLDAYDEESRTNFELDGAAYHSSARDRERDLRPRLTAGSPRNPGRSLHSRPSPH